MLKNPLSIYFHWPYCKSKCPYCDFFKRVTRDVNQREIIDLYCKQLEYYHLLVPDRVVRSVFFGGGTPSLIKPEYISCLLEKISKLWSLESNIEISLEANPNSEYPNMFKQLRLVGINRLSLGVQALNESDLRFLGRTHNLKQALHSIEEVLSVFDNHSMDLIYARPNQNLATWENELKTAVSFGFRHLSMYQLTIEEGTVFAARNVKSLDDEAAASMYQFTTEYLLNSGYPRYEVSNYAKQEFESKHNKCYWLGDDYIGIGESAHGRLKIGNKFYALEYPHRQEELTPEMRAEELIIMGLRLQKGIEKQKFKQICGIEFDDFVNPKAAETLSKCRLIKNTKLYCAPTYKGFLLLNRIIEELCC